MLTKVAILDWVTVHCKPVGDSIIYPDNGYKIKRMDRGTRTCAIWEEAYMDSRRIATINREPFSSVMDSKSVWVKFDNWMLYRANFFEEMKTILHSWGLQFIGYSRIDFALDYQQLDNGESPVALVKQFLSGDYLKIGKGKYANHGDMVPVGYEEGGTGPGDKYATQGNYHFTYEPQYLRFGSPKNPDIVSYTYNKRKELSDVGDKPWIRQQWKENGEDATKPVWRLEFSIRAKCVKFLDKETAEELDTHNIDLISPVHRQGVFSALLAKYWQFCRADDPDQNKARRPRIPVLSMGATPFRVYTNCQEEASNRMEKIMIKKLYNMYADMRMISKEERKSIMDSQQGMIRKHGLQEWATSQGYVCEEDKEPVKFEAMLPQRGDETVIHLNGNTQDAIDTISQVIRESAEHPYIKELANALMTSSGGKNSMWKQLLEFAYKSAYYEGNDPHWQRIRRAHRTIEDGRANCVDYTILMCAIAKALPLSADIRMRVVSYDGENYVHIFPVINGHILDCVPEQEQLLGIEATVREFPSTVSFNHTLPYVSASDYLL